MKHPSKLIKNKYYKIYRNICKRAKSENRNKTHFSNPSHVYYEEHHIIPKSIYNIYLQKRDNRDNRNSKNHPRNLVLLTDREHFIVHACLIRFLKKEPLWMMIQAMVWITGNGKYKNSRLYEANKKEYSKGLYEVEGNGKTRIENRSIKCSKTRIENGKSIGPKNSQAKRFVFIDAKGIEMFCCFGSLRATCKEHNFSYSQVLSSISKKQRMYSTFSTQNIKIRNTNISKLKNSKRIRQQGWRIVEVDDYQALSPSNS